jgi:very-short-patch-repair endonuclease
MPWKQTGSNFIGANARKHAPTLRRNMTQAERVLWKALRREIVVPDSHFRRQVAIGSYVVDFCSLRYRFVIEVDGEIHKTVAALLYDEDRDRYLPAEGFKVVRFANHDVTTALPTVLERLRQEFESVTPTPSPSPQGAGQSHMPMLIVIPGPRSGTRNPERWCRRKSETSQISRNFERRRHSGFRVPLRGPGMTTQSCLPLRYNSYAIALPQGEGVTRSAP